ncbi:RNA recognition motif domain-containing protein [Ditylenchus destructor]|nr:RNA recognition motif domain-containing protein [Ditylenchus destructor]
MLNLRSAVQRCVRRASIVGSCPLRHHTSRNNSNVIYVSRQTFADANVELVENASQHSGIKHLTNEIQTTAVTDNKPLPDIANESEATPSFSDTKSPDMIKNPEAKEIPSITDTKSLPDIANDPEAIHGSEANATASIDDTAQNPKNLLFRRYHILVKGFSGRMTEDALQKFYSNFGDVIRCNIVDGERFREAHAYVVFSSKEAMNLAVSTFPHRINNETVRGRIGNLKTELTLRLLNLSPETTEESLKEFYSRFGRKTRCEVRKGSEAGERKLGYVAFGSQEELDRALDAQPHLIDGSEVFLTYPTGDPTFIFCGKKGLNNIVVRYLPENTTRASLFKAFSKFGKITYLEVYNGATHGSYGIIDYCTQQEADKAVNAGPHEIEGVPVYVEMGKEIDLESRKR